MPRHHDGNQCHRFSQAVIRHRQGPEPHHHGRRVAFVPCKLAAFLEAEIGRFGKLIRETGTKLD